MNHDQDALVERLFALTKDMETAAILADWPRVAELDAARTPLLRALTREQSPQALATIREIQGIDAAVLAEATATRSELATEYHSAMKRVNAASRYQQGARF
jgi:flagellar protein FliT